MASNVGISEVKVGLGSDEYGPNELREAVDFVTQQLSAPNNNAKSWTIRLLGGNEFLVDNTIPITIPSNLNIIGEEGTLIRGTEANHVFSLIGSNNVTLRNFSIRTVNTFDPLIGEADPSCIYLSGNGGINVNIEELRFIEAAVGILGESTTFIVSGNRGIFVKNCLFDSFLLADGLDLRSGYYTLEGCFIDSTLVGLRAVSPVLPLTVNMIGGNKISNDSAIESSNANIVFDVLSIEDGSTLGISTGGFNGSVIGDILDTGSMTTVITAQSPASIAIGNTRGNVSMSGTGAIELNDFTKVVRDNLAQEILDRVNGDEGTVTIHGDVSDAGSGQIITSQERTDINASVNVHSDSNIDFAGAQDGDEIIIVGGNLVRKPKPIYVERIPWSTTTNDIDTPNLTGVDIDPNSNLVIDQSVNIPEAGNWKPTISFLHAHDNTGNDFRALCTIGGSSIALSQPTSNRIINKEAKDVAGENPDHAPADTAQIEEYGMQFASRVLPAGPIQIQLIYGPEAGGTQSSIAEITIKLERIY